MRPLSPWSRRAAAPRPASHATPASAPAHPLPVSAKPTSIGSQPPRLCMLSTPSVGRSTQTCLVLDPFRHDLVQDVRAADAVAHGRLLYRAMVRVPDSG